MTMQQPSVAGSAEPPRSPRAPREVRLGVVLYGGVSLAVYIAGVTRELYELVSATADGAEPRPGSTGELYRQLARGGALDEGGDPAPETRYVIDAISGSSAGGINGIVLAKALVTGAGVSTLGPLWRDTADITTLLEEPGAGRTLAALLNGDRLRDALREALASMDASTAAPLARELDLWITTTDLIGVRAPLHAAGLHGDLREARNAHVLRFRHDDDGSHFAPPYNGLLAFAGRATSSFPVAFEPARLDKEVLEPPGANLQPQLAELFFPDHKREQLEQWPWGDGGDIDNKPWSYVLRTIEDRRSLGWVERKLLFVEPDPSAPAPGGPRALSTLQSAWRAFSLGRNETIRQDIESIDRYNRRVAALVETLDTVDRTIRADIEPPWREAFRRRTNTDWVLHRYDVRDVGTSYAAYHELKVADLIRELARFLHVSWPEGTEGLQGYVRRWTEPRFGPTIEWPDATGAGTIVLPDDRPSENALLKDLDVGYRLRRLSFMSRVLTDLRRGKGGATVRYGTFLDSHGIERATPAGEEIDRLMDACNASRSSLLRLRNELERRGSSRLSGLAVDAGEDAKQVAFSAVLDDVRNHGKSGLRAIGEAIESVLPPVARQDGPVTVDNALVRFSRQLWDDYENYDEQLFGLAVLDTAELAPIDVFRMSPLDTKSVMASTERLGGARLGHFGGLFDQKLRRLDLLWGRIDAAERLLDVMGVPPEQQPPMLEELQRRIIDEENAERPPGTLDQLVPDDRSPHDALTGLFPVRPGIDQARIERIVQQAGVAAQSVLGNLSSGNSGGGSGQPGAGGQAGRGERLVGQAYRLLRHWHTAGILVIPLGLAGLGMLVAVAVAAAAGAGGTARGAIAIGAATAAGTAALSAWRGVGPDSTLPWARRALLASAALMAALGAAVLRWSAPLLLGVTAAAVTVAAFLTLLSFALIAALQQGTARTVRWLAAKVAAGLGVGGT